LVREGRVAATRHVESTDTSWNTRRVVRAASVITPGPGGVSGVEILLSHQVIVIRSIVQLVALAAVFAMSRPASAQPLINENFDNVASLFATGGWTRTNLSTPPPPAGTGMWQQGASFAFPAHIGAPNACISATFNSAGPGVATISNWLITPPVTLQNGQVFRFFTRTRVNPADQPDRLQVRLSLAGASGDVGTTATSVGVFTTLLLDINPTYTATGYPAVWTEYVITLSGIGSPTLGRLAFRYFVEGGGPSGFRSDIVGIDTVSLAATQPNPCDQPLGSCSADVVVSGAVDADDLVAVILAWGQNNPSGPRPPADCAPLPNGDCQVNADDLIQVILTWGACPPVTGACCLAEGACLNAQTFAQCVQAGGVYQGNNVNCSQVQCPQPNNDFCQNATTVQIGGSASGNLENTNPDNFATCNGVATSALGRWHKVVGNGSVLTASLCSSAGAFDSRLSVYCGPNCKALTCVTAADANTCGQHETVSWCSAPGQTYHILVHASAVNPGQGAYTLTIAGGGTCGNPPTCGPQPPPNDNCVNAIQITNGPTPFTTIAATTDGAPLPVGQCDNSGAMCAADIWYRYTASCTGTLRLTTCAELGGSTDFDTVIVVYQNVGCPPPDAARIACDDDDTANPCGQSPPFASTALAPVSAGQTYLIRVGGFFDKTDVGSGVLNLMCIP
jgi:hypothetical protein